MDQSIKIVELNKKEEEQKHPMYPIHWGGYDKNIKEFVESEFDNEDSVDGLSDLLQKAKDLTEGVEVDLDKSLDEQCEWDNLPKSFPNEFQDEVTTAENLEERFDNEKDILDYFNKIKVTTESIGDKEEWKCPCNICKEGKVSWEEAASDLALKVAKLERQIEELKTIKITSDPNYQHFLKHGKWPWHWNKENKLDSSREYDNL